MSLGTAIGTWAGSNMSALNFVLGIIFPHKPQAKESLPVLQGGLLLDVGQVVAMRWMYSDILLSLLNNTHKPHRIGLDELVDLIITER